MVVCDTQNELSLLQLGEKCLGLSRLIFLIADLRLLSSTGRINTNFEALALDSDRFLRTSAKGMACIVQGAEKQRGLTSNHITAILLLEMNRSLADQSIMDDDDASFEENRLLHNLRMSRSDPVLAQKAEGDLHALLRSYCQTMRDDLCDDLPKLPSSLLSQMSSPSNQTGSSDLHFASPPIPRYASARKQAEKLETANEFKSLGDLIFSSATNDEEADVCSKDELVAFLKRAVAKRDSKVLEVLSSFFREGSLSKMMADSKSELVWLHDWHPQKECTYAISIDHQIKSVVVIFRGATTYSDWDHSIHWDTVKIQNPIAESYVNKSDNIKMHSGFYRYLFRKRKDTGTTKYDEIASKVNEYARILGDDFQVLVTGHSLGGALTNIFAFYASLEDRFTRNGAVQAVTFGCPRMAAYQFADAVKYQGDIGKLQIARFHNQKDAIAHLPPYLIRCSKRGAKYYHLGLDVHLPLIRKNIFTILGQPQPKVTFWDTEGWFQSYKRQWCEFYGFNVPVRPWMLANHHSLIEHQKRMQLVNSESPLMKASLAEIYDMQEEYTANKIKRRNKVNVSSETYALES